MLSRYIIILVFVSIMFMVKEYNMIGGLEVRFDIISPFTLEIAIRAIKQIWPTLVVEDIDGIKYSQFDMFPFLSQEVFVYRDEEAFQAWDGIKENINSMVHLLVDTDSLTVVFDERDRTIDSILAAIRSLSSDPLFRHTVGF